MHLHRAVALQPTLPSFISFFTPSSTTNTSLTAQSTQCTDVTQTFSLSPYLLILCVILLAFLLFKYLRRCSFDTNSCMLILEIGNHSNTTLLDWQSLPGSPNQYTCSACKFIEQIKIIGCQIRSPRYMGNT